MVRPSSTFERTCRTYPSPGLVSLTRAPREPEAKGQSAYQTAARRGSEKSSLECSLAYAKSELTESELWIRLMASPRRRAMLTCRIFLQAFASAERGIVSVTMTEE